MIDTADAEDTWLMTRAVVRGTGHIKLGVACQDYCDCRVSRDGHWLVAAVCDGAGSAARSDEGARLVAEWVTRGLIAEIANIEAKGPGIWIKDRVHAILLDARQQLRDRGDQIRDFACTLVGALVGPTGGFFFHIGDGAAVASHAGKRVESDGETSRERLYLWDRLVVSAPENGDFANETYFVTQDDWDRHLRSTAIPANTDIVMLMSDGGMEFVLPRQRINPAWINPVVGQLLRTADDDARGRLVHDYLADPEADPVTSDDKTLFVAIRRRMLKHAGQPLSMAAPPPAGITPRPDMPAETPARSTLGDRTAITREVDQAHQRTAPPELRPRVAPGSDRRSTIALVLSSIALAVSLIAVVLSLSQRRDPPAAPAHPGMDRVEPDAAPAAKPTPPGGKPQAAPPGAKALPAPPAGKSGPPGPP